MPRIEEIKDIGYKIILPELEKFDKEIVEVFPNLNETELSEPKFKEIFAVKESNNLTYTLPEIKLIKPLEFINKNIINVKENNNLEKDNLNKNLILIAKNENDSTEIIKNIVMVAPNENILEESIKDIVMVAKDENTLGKPTKDIVMVAPNENTSGKPVKDIVYVASNENNSIKPTKDIVMVAPNENNQKVLNKDIVMVAPNENNSKSLNYNIVQIEPMIKEPLVSSMKDQIDFEKGVVLSKYYYVEVSLESSLENHIKDTVDRITSGYVENIDDWMREKINSLSKEFHDFVSKTIRDYENALMDPINTLTKNLIQDPLGTLSEFPKNIISTFNEIGTGIVNTTVDAAVEIGNKAVDIANIGVGAINTGVEVINSAGSVLGFDRVPKLKIIPKLPSREEILNQAVMKGGNLAKNGDSNFNIDAFKNKAMEGQLDREMLRGMAEHKNSLPDDYVIGFSDSPLWFIPNQEIECDEKPIILDNAGIKAVDVRKIGEKTHHFKGFREGPFNSAMDNIYKGVIGFQGVPDIFCDISITPHVYTVSSSSGNLPVTKQYFPPKYPANLLGGYMITDFSADDVIMNTEENWNLGIYGNLPLVANLVLPSSLSISFAADANLHTTEWVMATMEYMFGGNLNPHVMRPYKMCCHDITIHATTFYGETLYAKTFIAYPKFGFKYNMLGTGSIKIHDTEWTVVGLMEYVSKSNLLKEMTPELTEPESGEEISISGDPPDPPNAVSGKACYFNSNSTSISDKESETSTINGHVDSFIESVKKSDIVQNIVDNPTTKKLLNDLKNSLGEPFSSMDLDMLFVCKNAKYLVCVYSNHVQKPGTTNVNSLGVQYNVSNLDDPKIASILAQRFTNNDTLTKDRAVAYLKALKQKNIDLENIKVILASQDGIPGMDHNIQGPPQKGAFYLGGVHLYEEEANKVAEDNQSLRSLIINRRTDLIHFEDFVEKVPQAIKEMLGIDPNLTKPEIIWNKIPKISYGRESVWGNNDYYTQQRPGQKRYPTCHVDSSLGNLDSRFSSFKGSLSSYSAPAVYSDRTAYSKKVSTPKISKSSSSKNTTEEKLEELFIKENNIEQLLEYGENYEENLKIYSKVYSDIDKIKVNTKEKEGVIFDKTYKINTLITHEQILKQNLVWWKQVFGKSSYMLTKDKLSKITLMDDISNNNFLIKLPKDNLSKKEYPLLIINSMSLSIIENSDKLLLNNFFLNNEFCWIYLAKGSDELYFIKKVDII